MSIILLLSKTMPLFREVTRPEADRLDENRKSTGQMDSAENKKEKSPSQVHLLSSNQFNHRQANQTRNHARLAPWIHPFSNLVQSHTSPAYSINVSDAPHAHLFNPVLVETFMHEEMRFHGSTAACQHVENKSNEINPRSAVVVPRTVVCIFLVCTGLSRLKFWY